MHRENLNGYAFWHIRFCCHFVCELDANSGAGTYSDFYCKSVCVMGVASRCPQALILWCAVSWCADYMQV